MLRSDRRQFLKHLTGGVVASAMVPTPLLGSRAPAAGWRESLASLPYQGDHDEAFWAVVKGQFPLRDDLIIMNAANLCPSPYPVIEAVRRYTQDVDGDASFQNRSKFSALKDAAREGLATMLGADVEEIAITRNTSESNNTVVNGLTLGSGDEVVLWDQNHPTNNVSWDVRAERYGYTVKRVSTPHTPTTAEALVAAFESALTPRTRVLSFSHVSNVSGIGLPAKTLCTVARDRGILSMIDGAQTFGSLHVNLHDIGCDFYTGSAHKWFVGPKEAGVLFVKRDQIEHLWPTHVGVGWASATERGAQKFDNMGQRDDACVAAVGTAVEFHQAIGFDQIETRVRALAASLKRRLQEQIPAIRFHTPLDSDLSAGVVVFAVPGVDAREAFNALYRDHSVACAARGGDFAGVRLCPHIYNTMGEVERVVTIIDAMV